MAGMPRAGPAGRRCALVGGVSAVLRETGQRRRRGRQLDADHGKLMAAHQAHPDWIGREFWALFRVEGMGADYQLVERTGPGDAAVLALCQEEPAFRERLLVESRKRCCEIFSEEHRLVLAHASPGRSGRARGRRQHAYLAVLATAPSTAVGLAQDMLKRAVGLLDADAMIDAGAAVLTRGEEAGQGPAGLFAALRTDAGSETAFRGSSARRWKACRWTSPLARKLVDSSDETQRAATDGEMGARKRVRPRQSRYRRRVANRCRICPTTRSPSSMTRHCMPDPRSVRGRRGRRRIARLFAHLASRPQLQLPEALRHRAAEIIESCGTSAMPRRDACWPPRCWAGMTSVSGLCPLCRGQRGQAGSRGRGIAGKHLHQPTLRRGDRRLDDPRDLDLPLGYQYLPTHAPLALLAGVFHELRASRMRASRSFRRWRFPSSASCGNGCWPSRAQGLSRATCRCWEKGPSRSGWRRPTLPHRLPWMSPTCPPIHLPRPGGGNRMATTRWCNGRPGCCDPTPTLAAHFHPMLCAAVNVINVRGLGRCWRRWARPAGRRADPCTRLALAASAKMTEQRAQAAEAIARLADVGLLDPAPFAEQIAAHLADGFALAGRLAQTLADASSISALAGCRALQTLEALLPRLVDADGKPMAQAAKLIELAARLSNDYGMPIALPATLAARAGRVGAGGDLAQPGNRRAARDALAETAAAAQRTHEE